MPIRSIIVSGVLAGAAAAFSVAAARGWRRVEVPGALCGDGSPYSIFLSGEGRDHSRVAFAFQGGGGCWDALTCHGPIPFARGSARAFWERFSREYQRDLRAGFATMGVNFDPHDGLVARHAHLICRRLPRWRIGILQGARDIVMSAVFGQISPFAHERMVYGRDGLYEETEDPGDNCVTFAPRTFMHTFLGMSWSSRIRAGGMSAMDFARQLLAGTTGPNLR